MTFGLAFPPTIFNIAESLLLHIKSSMPVISQDDRMEILKGLRAVDEVVLIDDTPDRLTEWKRRPFDCFFSGNDHSDKPYWIWEQQELKKLGADLVYFPYTEEESTTKIRARIRETE